MPNDGLDVAAAVAAIVGEANVVRDAAEREAYAYDALGPQRASVPAAATPIAVVRPASAEEVAAILRLAGETRTPVVPYGGGSGLMGGARSVVPSTVIDMQRMNAVLEIDAADGVVWAEAGAVLRDVDAALAPHNLMVGHDPWTFGVATVGGTISTNGLGFLGGKYGSMGEQVLALEAVMPDGAILRTRPARPHSTAPDLTRLLIAGEGAFGIITAAALRAFPIAEARVLRGYRFAAFAAGVEALVEMRGIGLAPTVLDYGDHPVEGETSTLYLGFDGFREEVAALVERSRAICDAHGATGIEQAEVEDFWESRHAIADRFAESRAARRGPPQPRGNGAFDYIHVALPVSRVLEYRAQALRIAADADVYVYETGLWVAPSLFSMTMSATGEDAGARLTAAVDKLLRSAQDAGGSMEYCHGAGIRLAHLMAREHGPGLEVLRSLKRAVDPHGILNPGKLGLD